MHCTIYRLRREGVKLPTEEVRAGGVSGWLEVRQFMQHPGLQARLYRSPQDAAERPDHPLMELGYPSLGRVSGGVLLKGSDGIHHRKQAWWVVPTAAPPETPPPAPA